MTEVGESEHQVPSLFDQTKDRTGNFGRGKLPADVITIVNRRLERLGPGFASKAQIQKVLESVPSVFPEDWQAPSGKIALYPQRLPERQREVFEELQRLGPRRVSAQKIQAIIDSGVHFRENYSR